MKKNSFNGRRKFLFSAISLALGGLVFGYKAISKNHASSKRAIQSTPKPNARLGINFSGIAYWGSEYPFVDLMHQSGGWVSQPPSGDWGTGPALVLDKHGWVKQLAPKCKATKILCAGEGNEYPTGTYVILYEGEGEIQLNSPQGKITKRSEGRLEVDIDAKKGMVMFGIDIVSTNPKNYIRNMRVIVPGFESRYAANPWHPDFLKRWSGVACIRLMDMMATNNSNQINWTDRPQLSDASYAEKGVPAEWLVDLANRLESDVWFCMPHQANDDYIEQFAVIVKNNLNPKLKAWVEYSNEVWNGGFEQYTYAAEQGQRLKFGDDEWESAYHYNAYRSVEIFNIWQAVFVSNERLTKVIASQAANVYLSEQLFTLPDIASMVDVLAIAPYVSLNVPQNPDEAGISANKVSKWNLDKVFEYVNKVALPMSKNWIRDNKKVADAYGVKLVAYEAGQHLVGTQGAENNQQLTALLMKANADQRMGAVYTKYCQHWQQAGGDVICMFNSVGGWSKWGSWGLLQHTKETAADSPKFKAVMDWAQAHGQKVKY